MIDGPAVLRLGEREAPLGELLQRAERNLLAVVHEVLDRHDERVMAVLRHELLQSARTDPRGRDARPHVASEEVGQSRVDFEQAHQRLVRPPGLDQLDGRQPEALLEDLLGLGGDAPRSHAADVVPVRDVGCPGDDLAVREHGHREHDVVQVRDAAVVGVVGREDVAVADLLGRVELEHPLHGLVEHAYERRDPSAARRQAPLRVGHAGAHVEHLVDDRAHRRPAHGGEHLVAGRLQARLDDLEGDGVVARGHVSSM